MPSFAPTVPHAIEPRSYPPGGRHRVWGRSGHTMGSDIKSQLGREGCSRSCRSGDAGGDERHAGPAGVREPGVRNCRRARRSRPRLPPVGRGARPLPKLRVHPPVRRGRQAPSPSSCSTGTPPSSGGPGLAGERYHRLIDELDCLGQVVRTRFIVVALGIRELLGGAVDVVDRIDIRLVPD